MLNPRSEILVVDDEPSYRILVYKKLKNLGYRTYLAQNGEEAIVALWEKPSIGLVLLDVRLPHINGLNISEIIRKDFPDKKIIICSVLQKSEQEFLVDGVEDYYCKEEDLDNLIERVENIFNNKNRLVKIRDNDKRNSRRIPVNVFASCEKVNQQRYPSSIHFFSYTKDLSKNGGRFIVAEDIQVGQHFSASLELPNSFLPLLIDCEVIWVKKLDEFNLKAKKNIEVGVKFVKLDLPQDEEKLRNYLSYV